jgi:hypothetical protein
MTPNNPFYILMYFVSGVLLSVMSLRGIRRDTKVRAEPLFLAVGIFILLWAIFWAFGLHKLAGT